MTFLPPTHDIHAECDARTEWAADVDRLIERIRHLEDELGHAAWRLSWCAAQLADHGASGDIIDTAERMAARAKGAMGEETT